MLTLEIYRILNVNMNLVNKQVRFYYYVKIRSKVFRFDLYLNGRIYIHEENEKWLIFERYELKTSEHWENHLILKAIICW